MRASQEIDYREVERASRQLIERLWHKRAILFPMGLADRFQLLDPRVACNELGLVYEPHPTLQWGYSDKGLVEIAGVLDRDAQKVYVAQKYGPEAERFTAAHELGHYLMHPNEVMHRDVPEGRQREFRKPPIEREADYFAACLLVPANLLCEEFERRFGPAKSFSFEGASEFWLNSGRPGWQLAAGNRDQRSLVIATARRFEGRSFPSLCERFRVSRSAMSIRLIETGLVSAYP